MLRCKISLHPKIADMLDTCSLPISEPYKLIIKTYLMIHSKNLVKMALHNLHADDDVNYLGDYIDTEQGRDISNMFFSDLIHFEDKIDLIVDQIKLYINNGFLQKGLKVEIKKVLKLIIANKRSKDIEEVVSVWEALSVLLSGFAVGVIAKVYNRGTVKVVKDKKTRQLTKEEKLELMRLEAFVYLTVAFNEMDLFLPDYAGETMMQEMMTITTSKDMQQMQGLILRLRGILEH